jgi:transposase-like protein
MSGRVEILTGPERRRRWSEEEKLQLVELSPAQSERGAAPTSVETWTVVSSSLAGCVCGQ